MAISTNGLQLVRLAGAVFNQQLSASDYSEILAANKTAAELDAWANSAVAAEFKNKTTTDIAKAVLTNVGLSSVAGLEAWVAGQLTAGGGVAKAGATMLSMLNDFSNMTADATYGAAATTFNTKAAASQTLSQTAGTATGTYANAGNVAVGGTFSLTSSIDNLVGGALGDVFIGDNGIVSAADQINGGEGTDTIKIYSAGTTILPSLTSVESVYIKDTNGMDDLNIASEAAITSLEFEAVATQAAADNTITLAAGQTLKLTNVTDGHATDGASGASGSADGSLFVSTASTVTALTIDLNKVGTSTEAVDLLVTGSGVATLNLSSNGTVSYVNPAYTPSALKTLNVSGAKSLDLDDSAITTLTTINASSMTAGGLKVSVSGSTLDVAFTGGAGNDTLTVDADLDIYDVINGGDGTDTVVVSDATLTSSTLAAIKGANATVGVEVLGVSATATITIDASKFSSINTFTNTAAVTGTAGSTASAAGQDAVNFTFQTGDAFTVGANLTGGAGAASAGEEVGGDALEVAAAVNTGTDAVTINFAKGAATTLTGGAGANGTTSIQDGGHAINASTVETINIVTASSLDDVTLTGGASGSAGSSDGATIYVGANATVNLSGAGDVNLGTLQTATTAADDLTVNGSAMTGVLTVTTGAGNDVIIGGTKADVITAGTGVNTVTGNAGADNFKFADDASKGTALTTITDFAMGAGNDVITFTTAAGVFEALTADSTSALASLASTATLADALEAVDGQLAEHEATAFVFNGNAYVIYEEADDSDGYTAANYSVVKLAGITSVTTFDATNIA